MYLMGNVRSDNVIDYVINYSLENHKAIDIIYMKGIEITKRRIKVVKIGDGIIKAVDIKKGQIRNFKKDSILSAMFTSSLAHKDINTKNYRQDMVNHIH